MKKVLYIYTSGRGEIICRKEKCDQPIEFLYGYDYLLQLGYDVDYIESDFLRPYMFSLEYWKLRRSNQKQAMRLGIGNRSHFFLNQVHNLNRYDVIVATTDSIGLGLAYFKKIGRLKAEVICLSMGLAAALERLKSKDAKFYQILVADLRDHLIQFKTMWIAGKGERDFLATVYKDLESRIHYKSWGIDINFWSSRQSSHKYENYILFVGNDMNRDYDQLIDIVESRPEVRFVVVSRNVALHSLPSNVSLYQGSMKKPRLTHVELREIYLGASLVILPLKQSLQPSGQSVALQAMACERVVAITKTRGIWDLDIMKDGENCILVEHGIEAFTEVIDQAISSNNPYSHLGHNARQSVEKHCDLNKYSQWLCDVIER